MLLNHETFGLAVRGMGVSADIDYASDNIFTFNELVNVWFGKRVTENSIWLRKAEKGEKCNNRNHPREEDQAFGSFQ